MRAILALVRVVESIRAIVRLVAAVATRITDFPVAAVIRIRDFPVVVAIRAIVRLAAVVAVFRTMNFPIIRRRRCFLAILS